MVKRITQFTTILFYNKEKFPWQSEFARLRFHEERLEGEFASLRGAVLKDNFSTREEKENITNRKDRYNTYNTMYSVERLCRLCDGWSQLLNDFSIKNFDGICQFS